MMIGLFLSGKIVAEKQVIREAATFRRLMTDQQTFSNQLGLMSEEETKELKVHDIQTTS